MEAENVHDGIIWFAGVGYDPGMDGYQIPIAEHVPDRDLLVRELDVIVDHGFLQCRKAGWKKRIVVFTMNVHILLVSFIYLARDDKLQELYGDLFMVLYRFSRGRRGIPGCFAYCHSHFSFRIRNLMNRCYI